MAISNEELARALREMRDGSEANKKTLTNETRSAGVGVIKEVRTRATEVVNDIRRAGKRLEDKIASTASDIKSNSDENSKRTVNLIAEHVVADGDKTRNLIKTQSGRHSAGFVVIWLIIGAIVGAIVFAICKFTGGDVQPVVDSAGNIVDQIKVAWPTFKCFAIAIPAGFLAFTLGLLIPEKGTTEESSQNH